METDTADAAGKNGVIFDIQRFSLHDGPGIRTLVFMKGCPLRCLWCSNPESQSRNPQVLFYEEKCIGCGACYEVCPRRGSLLEDWPVPREDCTGCGCCVEVCFAGARELSGRVVSVREVLDVVLRDRTFYEQSEGGVTVGGGEPLLQYEFTAGLLRACRENGLHTAVETCGFAGKNALETVLQHTDLLLFDLKHMDTEVHKRYTGAGNERILENARFASKTVRKMVIRMPLIPGVNSDETNIEALAGFIKNELEGVERVDILPYHTMGASKITRLGGEYPLGDLEPLTQERIDRTTGILKSRGLKVTVGG
ncbi:MAG: glycyl-radical enzyme activating protein [Spirochaetes bacterium]|nr:glycyl-radical enzyme activating protein [Spirochaetota bacterium]